MFVHQSFIRALPATDTCPKQPSVPSHLQQAFRRPREAWCLRRSVRFARESPLSSTGHGVHMGQGIICASCKRPESSQKMVQHWMSLQIFMGLSFAPAAPNQHQQFSRVDARHARGDRKFARCSKLTPLSKASRGWIKDLPCCLVW